MKYTQMRWLLFLCSLVLSSLGFGQEYYEVNRTTTRAFAWHEDIRLEIENKYGDVIFETWEQDSIRVQVHISVKSKKPETAQELSDMAVTELYRQGSFIIGRTDWAANSSIWNQAKNEMRNVFGADQKVEITYKVWLPKTTSIEVNNKFGDVFLPDFDGEVILDISHGNLRGSHIQNPHSITVHYGDVKVDTWGKGSLNLLFAELHADETDRLKIVSRSSKIYLNRAEILEIQSRNDELYLKDIGTLRGQYNFTSTEIDLIRTSVDIQQEYGDLEIKSFDPGYSLVIIKPKRSKVKLRLDSEVPVNFYVSLTYGERFASVPEYLTISEDNEEEDTRTLSGYWSASGSQRNIRIEGEKSIVELASE